MTLAQELAPLLTGEVTEDEATLTLHSHDASIFRIRPAAVVFPKHVGDLTALITYVREQRLQNNRPLSLTARSAGTDMSGGPLSESIVVAFTKYFNHLATIVDDQVVVEPGVFYRDFATALLPHNRIMPAYPASKDLCTIGGMVANNAGGEKTLTYGKVDRYVHALKMLLDDGQEYTFSALTWAELATASAQPTRQGEIYRQLHQLLAKYSDIIASSRPTVSKNSAGYNIWDAWNPQQKIFDPTKLIVGSQGTLGLLSEITMGVVRPKTHSRMLVIFLKDFTWLAEVIARVLARNPESFESYDDQTLKVALRFLPELGTQMNSNILALILRFLPEFWMVLTGAAPKLVLIAEFTADTAAEALSQAQNTQASLQDLHLTTKITRSAADAQKYWTMRRESFNLLRHHAGGLHTAPFIDDFIVKPSLLPAFLPQLYTILNRYPIIYTVAGHIGDGNFHIIPLLDFAKPDTRDVITDLNREVSELVFKFKGSITGEHNDGLIRGAYLEQAFGTPVFTIFTAIKRIFDPHNIFNPGKKTQADWTYATAHIQAEDTPTKRHSS